MKITRMLILLCFCVCLHMQAQTERFIENYKKEYHQLVNKNTDTSLLYMPQIMNFSEGYDVLLNKMPMEQRKENLFLFLSNHNLKLANDYAFDVKGCRLLYDPTGLLRYKQYKDKREMVDISAVRDFDFPVKVLLNYLEENACDYIFTIESTGYEVFWVIKNGNIFALVYDEKNIYFQVLDVESFLNDKRYDELFMNLGELCKLDRR